MAWLLDIYALPLAVAAAVGLLTGWACASATAGSPAVSRRPALLGLLPWVALVGGLASAVLVMEGRAALWAETALLMLAAYLAACALACGLRRLASG